MHCPRIDHFVRFNANGTIGKCGHMISPPGFESWQAMQASDWLKDIRATMDDDRWPDECGRCRDIEETGQTTSIRIGSIHRHKILQRVRPDYLILGGVLDNVCNSACQSCDATLSTKIGSLQSKNYIKIDNNFLFDRIPADRVVEVDLNGGEPTASPGYQKILEKLPPEVKILRVNTNGSRLLPNIQSILDKKIQLILTMSLDGIDRVHDYVRWPIRWANYIQVVDQYRSLRDIYPNLTLQSWTTLHALNVNDFDRIKEFCRQKDLDHAWAWLENPAPLNAKFTNRFTLQAKTKITSREVVDKLAIAEDNQADLDDFIRTQDQLRKISIEDYL